MIPLKPNMLEPSHYVRLHMTARAPAGTTIEDVTNPTFWSNQTHRLKPGAILEILSEDNALDCELRVLEVGPTFAKVRVLRNFIDSGEAAPKANDTSEVEVGYGGKNDRWRVLHLNQVIKSGFETRADAEKAAEEYRSKLAA